MLVFVLISFAKRGFSVIINASGKAYTWPYRIGQCALSAQGESMIERYSLPKMKAIWQDEFKFKTMLDIEIFALEALAKQHKVPLQAVSRIRKKAKFNLNKIKKIDPKTLVQLATIGGLLAFTFNWLYDLEMKIIRLERDANFDRFDDNDPRFSEGL